MFIRYSKQRSTVLNELTKLKTHPTANEVFEVTKKKIPNISLGTVYRNLNNLEKNGDIIKFSIKGTEHFDACVKPHIHICCEKCGKIIDDFDNLEKFGNLWNDNKYKINNIIINCICQKCIDIK